MREMGVIYKGLIMRTWLLLLLALGVQAGKVEYTGAVLEYKPYSSWVGGGLTILQENARAFLEHAAIASEQGADIIVFPEYGLTSTNLEGGDVLSLTQIVPLPTDKVVPCHLNHTSDHTRVLGELSCGAAELRLYLVVNLAELASCDACHCDCPDCGHRLYNTQVVLDRHGTVVARYRKKHLFLEPEFTPGAEDDASALFTTDFGVTFSLQTCFDIMYASPGVTNVELGIHDVAMSTAWIDELPFLTAPQIFRGWSAGLGVNLLVANLHKPESGMLGSGIFPGARGERSHYIYDHQGDTTLLLTSLATFTSVGHWSGNVKPRSNADERGSEPVVPRLRTGDMVFIHEDLTLYSHLLLQWQEGNSPITASLCHNDSLCCTITYTSPANTSSAGTERYMLLAYSGLVEKGSGVYSMFTQVCAVVFCLNDNIKTCARIEDEELPQVSTILPQEVKGVFRASHVFQSLLRRDLTLTPEYMWNYQSFPSSGNHHESSVRVTGDPGPLLAFTLMGRWYDRDP